MFHGNYNRQRIVKKLIKYFVTDIHVCGIITIVIYGCQAIKKIAMHGHTWSTLMPMYGLVS
jgi:uncharacterized membrane protein YraQ (UPF0718 family)